MLFLVALSSPMPEAKTCLFVSLHSMSTHRPRRSNWRFPLHSQLRVSVYVVRWLVLSVLALVALVVTVTAAPIPKPTARPQPLPDEVVKAWTAVGATAGWAGENYWGGGVRWIGEE